MVSPVFLILVTCVAIQSSGAQQDSSKTTTLPDSVVKAKSEYEEHLRLARERFEFEQRDALDRLTRFWGGEITRARRLNDNVLADQLDAEWKRFLASLGKPGPAIADSPAEPAMAAIPGSDQTASNPDDTGTGIFVELFPPLREEFNAAEKGETQERRDRDRGRASQKIQNKLNVHVSLDEELHPA